MRFRTRYATFIRLFLVAMCAVVRSATAAPVCLPHRGDIPVNTVLASAGFFANLRGAENSIHTRMDALLEQARHAAGELASREEQCKHQCQKPVVAVLFNSAPNQNLPEYDESSTCERLYQETSKSPIRYEQRRFKSDDEAKDWYQELTQGEGVDGEDLYRRCPGRCSPSYSSEAYRDGDAFIVSTDVVCGHARDKDDNQYRLSAAIRWVCPKD